MSRDLIGKSVLVTAEGIPTSGRYGVVQGVMPMPRGFLLVGVRFVSADGRHTGTIYLPADQLQVVHTPVFEFAGGARVALRDMLQAHRSDEAACEWIRGAAVGDHYPAVNGFRRVA